ncbi:hypothetical protein E3N88_31459 [Mikania micrantha]|uniref:Cystatin domain-containing protein n=1 Tax=Mikania micrantha TaxID=192012 RepID=A0A5N6MPH8_9ASTR|nr:hypothetical protein E3N88_31459 [Mikania micrantha]
MASYGKTLHGEDGWSPVTNLSDPKVVSVGNFAVTTHNLQTQSSLSFGSVVDGETKSDGGTNYKLTVAAKDVGDVTLRNYVTLVIDRPYQNSLVLVSFEGPAVLLCYTDEAGLCWSYDENVHAANKFAGKHHRVLLSASNSQISNGCPDVGTPYPSTVMPYTVTGVIVFVLQQNDHLMFEIKGDDIFVEHTLSLAEALCNLDFIALMVIQAMLGSWNKSAGASKHME